MLVYPYIYTLVLMFECSNIQMFIYPNFFKYSEARAV